MPEIITSDFKGMDRRNGGRLKLTLMEWVRLTIISGGVLVSILTFYLSTKSNITLLADDSKENKTVDKAQSEIILTLKGAVDTIKLDVACIKNSQDESSKLLYRILGKLEESDRRSP